MAKTAFQGGRQGRARHVVAQLDPDDCFWTLVPMEQAGSWRGRRTRLQYALESASGIPAEELVIAWSSVKEGQTLVVGCERTALQAAVEAGAVRASPHSLPSWCDELCPEESLSRATHNLDLLRDPGLLRICRRSSAASLAWIVICGLLLMLVLYGLERRVQTARSAARQWTLSLREAGEASVKPAPGRPWELAMLGELRQLRELTDTTSPDTAAASIGADQAIAHILAQWPQGERLQTDRLVVTESGLTVSLRAESVDALRQTQEALSAATQSLSGWDMQPISISAGKNEFQASIRAARTSRTR